MVSKKKKMRCKNAGMSNILQNDGVYWLIKTQDGEFLCSREDGSGILYEESFALTQILRRGLSCNLKEERNFEVEDGDILRVRTWEDLVDSYGETEDRNIACDPPFRRSDKHLCGEYIFLIEEGERQAKHVELETFSLFGRGSTLKIPYDALEKINREQLGRSAKAIFARADAAIRKRRWGY